MGKINITNKITSVLSVVEMSSFKLLVRLPFDCTIDNNKIKQIRILIVAND